MAGRRPERRLLEGPVAFWSLVVLLILAVYGGFRAMAPRPPRARRPASAATGPRSAAKATTNAALWGGKPLQLKKPVAVPVVVTAAVAAAAGPKGVGLTPEEVAARIQKACPSLVVFFSTGSPSSQEMFPQLVKLAQWPEAPEVLAFATDQDASDVDTFLRVNGAPFDAFLLHPAKPGELDTALSGVGIKIGKQLNTPLVAVIGSDCKVRGQWQGTIELGPVAALLHTAEAPKEEPD